MLIMIIILCAIIFSVIFTFLLSLLNAGRKTDSLEEGIMDIILSYNANSDEKSMELEEVDQNPKEATTPVYK